jgi:hypothetical protein
VQELFKLGYVKDSLGRGGGPIEDKLDGCFLDLLLEGVLVTGVEQMRRPGPLLLGSDILILGVVAVSAGRG